MDSKVIATRILSAALANDAIQYTDMEFDFEQLEAICLTRSDPKLNDAYNQLQKAIYAAKGALGECITDIARFLSHT